MLAPATSEISELIGTPFAYGGRGPDQFDCYGLVKHLYERRGARLPDYRSPSDQNRIGALMAGALTLWEPCDRVPGAVVVFRIMGRVSHCGIVVDDDRFIHTWEGSGGVCIERLSEWEKRVHGFVRYVGPR
jgi:cell wall-associated NlpC family hydrolase